MAADQLKVPGQVHVLRRPDRRGNPGLLDAKACSSRGLQERPEPNSGTPESRGSVRRDSACARSRWWRRSRGPCSTSSPSGWPSEMGLKCSAGLLFGKTHQCEGCCSRSLSQPPHVARRDGNTTNVASVSSGCSEAKSSPTLLRSATLRHVRGIPNVPALPERLVADFRSRLLSCSRNSRRARISRRPRADSYLPFA
jgi:hypothetical protein